MYICVSVCELVCVHVPTSFGARGSCVVTVCKLVPANNFVRQLSTEDWWESSLWVAQGGRLPAYTTMVT